MLQLKSVFKTGFLLGLIWGAWHFLVNVWGSSTSSGEVPLVIFLPVALFSFLLPYRILMVWVYDNTKSLLMAILMHMVLITFWLTFMPTSSTGIYIFTWFLVWAVLLWVLVLAVNKYTAGKLLRYQH